MKKLSDLPRKRKIYPLGKYRPRMVEGNDDLDSFFEELSKSTIQSLDIESTGLSPFVKDARIMTLQVDLLPQRSTWVLPIAHHESPWRHDQGKHLLAEVRAAMPKEPYVVAHNGKFDSLWLKVVGGVEIDIDWDTMLAAHLLDENRVSGLKHQVQYFFGVPDWDVDTKVKQGKARLVDLFQYAARDAYYTRELFLLQQKLLARDKRLEALFHELVMPLCNMFRDVEAHGVYVDRSRLEEVKELLEQEYSSTMAELHKYQPGLNVNSPKQVSEMLFKRLGMSPLDYTPTGNPATSESVLQRLSEHHPAPRLILKARAASKFLGTFVNSWMDKLDDRSRLHPHFKLHGTVTGRPSCEEPNLQQVPRDRRIRSLITAPPGWVFVEADQSQIELRVTAIESGDPVMKRIFKEGGDIHSTTAQEVTGMGPKKVPSDVWKDARKKAKAINFGFVYGMGAKKFKDYARDKYEIMLSDAEAQAFRDRFFQLYPGLERWHRRQIRKAQAVGFVRTKLGRKRRLPNIHSDDNYLRSEAERQAINSPVQGLAAEITLAGALEIHETFPRTVVNIVGTVHDAILMEVKEEYLEEVLPRIKSIMEKPVILDRLGVKLPIPLVAEIAVGPWGAGEEWHG